MTALDPPTEESLQDQVQALGMIVSRLDSVVTRLTAEFRDLRRAVIADSASPLPASAVTPSAIRPLLKDVLGDLQSSGLAHETVNEPGLGSNVADPASAEDADNSGDEGEGRYAREAANKPDPRCAVSKRPRSTKSIVDSNAPAAAGDGQTGLLICRMKKRKLVRDNCGDGSSDVIEEQALFAPVQAPIDVDDVFRRAERLRQGVSRDQDIHESVTLLQSSAGLSHVPSMLALAEIYYSGKVAKPGKLRHHKRAALMWWDLTLKSDPNNMTALCRKGEALFLAHDSTSSSELLQTSYDLFDKAASLGSLEGSFLKGRWLVFMAPSHRDVQRASQGKKLVEAAAAAGLPQAYVFLGHLSEFPLQYQPAVIDVPHDRVARERFIFSLYKKAADCGYADGLNDIASCYATGYGGVEKNFGTAAEYYSRAIEAGSLDAYDNLGTHYVSRQTSPSPAGNGGQPCRRSGVELS
jgi:TPR repeat protein